MNEPRRQHRCTTDHQVWLIITVMLGLALGTQAAAGKECHRETPLPADVQLIAPASEVPEAFARFAGVWTGEWKDSGGLCHTLVVEEVLANGFARVTFSAGTSVSLNIPLPGFFRVTGRIVDGVMRFHGQGPDRPEFTYRVTGETLSGTYKNEGHWPYKFAYTASLDLQDGTCDHASCALSACQNRDDTHALRDASWEKRRGKCLDNRQG